MAVSYTHLMGYLAAELVATTGLYIMGRKYISIRLFDKSIIHYLFAVILMWGGLSLIHI